jgi:hypothetical protein
MQDHSPTMPTPAEIADILRSRRREETERPAGGLALRWDNAEGYVDHDPDTAWIDFPWMGKTVEIKGPEAAKLIREDAESRRNS